LLTCECHTRRALGNTTFKGHGLNVKTAKAHDICVVKEKVKHMRTYVSLIKCRLMAINVRAYSNISILCDIIEDLLYWLMLKLYLVSFNRSLRVLTHFRRSMYVNYV